ncbi:MAG: monovalent cation/H+ antiporter subunit D family protein, partial [Rhodospirillaceae bacterium]|nr:monovalent cation/H+ antiporter subunit D family protein [Rhodospirillaceae bacterium]
MTPEFLIKAALLVPAVGAILVMLTGKQANSREGVTLITGVILFLCVANLFPIVADGGRPTLVVGE